MSAERSRDHASVAVARSGAVMAAGTMTSRVLGLVRVVLLASILGTTGLTAEAFQVANTLPNQFYLILAGGILNAVLVPQILKADAHADGGRDFVNRLLTLAITLLTIMTLVTVAAAPWLVRLYFDTTNPQALALSVVFAYVCLPQVFFYGLYTILGQLLTARGRFAAYMWAPVVANVVALAGLGLFLGLGLPRRPGVDGWSPLMVGVLAGSATLSIAMQAFFLLLPLRRMGFGYTPTWGFRGVGLGAASRVAKWTFAAVLVSQLGFIVTSTSLTWATDAAGPGAHVAGRTAYDIGFLLFMLPHSLITVSLVTALYPRMARAVANRDVAAVRADLLRGLRLPAVILVPAIAVGVTFAPLLVRAFLVGNSLADTEAVAYVATALFLGVIPYGWVYLGERFFYSHEDARTPFRVQVVVTSIAVVGALVARRLGPDQTAFVIGLAQSLAYVVGAAIAFTLIRRRVGPVGLRGVAGSYLRLGVPAALTAGLLHWSIGRLLPHLLEQGRVLVAAVVIASGAIVGIVTWGVAYALRVPEVAELLRPILGRLTRLRQG